jgi:hypothetical protein
MGEQHPLDEIFGGLFLCGERSAKKMWKITEKNFAKLLRAGGKCGIILSVRNAHRTEQSSARSA